MGGSELGSRIAFGVPAVAFAIAIVVAGGGWFAVGPTVSLLWDGAGNPIGAPVGGQVQRTLELLGYFHLLGFVIATLAAFAMGRFVSRPRVAEEPFVAAGAVAGEVADHRRRRGFLRRRRPADDTAPTAS